VAVDGDGPKLPVCWTGLALHAQRALRLCRCREKATRIWPNWRFSEQCVAALEAGVCRSGLARAGRTAASCSWPQAVRPPWSEEQTRRARRFGNKPFTWIRSSRCGCHRTARFETAADRVSSEYSPARGSGRVGKLYAFYLRLRRRPNRPGLSPSVMSRSWSARRRAAESQEAAALWDAGQRRLRLPGRDEESGRMAPPRRCSRRRTIFARRTAPGAPRLLHNQEYGRSDFAIAVVASAATRTTPACSSSWSRRTGCGWASPNRHRSAVGTTMLNLLVKTKMSERLALRRRGLLAVICAVSISAPIGWRFEGDLYGRS